MVEKDRSNRLNEYIHRLQVADDSNVINSYEYHIVDSIKFLFLKTLCNQPFLFLLIIHSNVSHLIRAAATFFHTVAYIV